MDIAGIFDLTPFGGMYCVYDIPVALVVAFEYYCIVFAETLDRAVEMPLRSIVGA